ncbi:hypothetical protein CBS9595_003047 [Malassezia furfur]|nr:hypothetical protein CBS9595_003047 [Malassezia furfur]
MLALVMAQDAPAPDGNRTTLSLWLDRRASHPRNGLRGEALAAWAQREATRVQQRFYFAGLAIGTPPQEYNVVLDTGSSDFWLADAQCLTEDGCDADLQRYNASASSTSRVSSTPIHLKYGVGEVDGTLVSDNVQVAGYKVANLTFARANRLGERTLTAPAAGVMGLGFQTLSTTRTIPFWEVLASEGKMQDAVFSFQLASNLDNIQNQTDILPGGTWTLGKIDHTQFRGEISWSAVLDAYGPEGNGFWGIHMDALKVNGEAIQLGNQSTASIDTGTTLLGGPAALVAQVYASVPGAARGSGDLAQYYTFPCDAQFNMTFVFNQRPWVLTNDTLNLGSLSSNSSQCIGAVFVADHLSSSSPAWVLGDSFLKTVYSVFSYHPPLVGFAQLPTQGVTRMPLTSLATHVETGTLPTTVVASSVERLVDTGAQYATLPTPVVEQVPTGLHLAPSDACARARVARIHAYGVGAALVWSAYAALGVSW